MKWIFAHLLLLCLLLSLNNYGQHRQYIFKNYTQEEGLPSNETYFVFEDSKHFLWIATDHGVVRYDGSKFETFQLSDNVVFLIKEDRQGKIWFFTQKGLLSYFENERVHDFEHNDVIQKRIQRLLILHAYFNESNDIILHSPYDSSYRISQQGVIEAFSTFSDRQVPAEFKITWKGDSIVESERVIMPLPNGIAISIEVIRQKTTQKYFFKCAHEKITHYGAIAGEDGDAYFFAGKHIFRLNKDGTSIKREFPTEILSLKLFRGQLLAGTMRAGGIFLSPDLVPVNSAPILPGKSISCITSDFEGGTWFSTLETGIFYMKNPDIQVWKHKNAEELFISRIYNLDDNQLIYSTSTGVHLLKDDASTEVLGLNNSNTSELLVDDQRNLYFLGGIEMVFKVQKSTHQLFNTYRISSTPSEAIFMDNGQMMISGPYCIYLWKKSFIANLTAQDQIIALTKPGKLFSDAHKNIWAGTTNGLYLYDYKKQFFEEKFTSSPILKKGITCLRQLENGLLAAGIRFAGVALIGDTGVTINITEKDGLLSNKVKYLMPQKNALWVATAKGISVIVFNSYSPLTYTIKNIGKTEGLYNITINQLMQYKDGIAAATSNGIYFINQPNLLLQKSTERLPFYIKTISYYAGDTTAISQVSVPYGKTSVLIKYAAVTFNSSDRLEYWYRLSGTDTNWIKTSSEALALENFEPGNYRLQLKATVQNENRTSEIINFSIVVEKAWWQGNLLRMLVALLIASAVFWYFNKRVKKIRAEEEEKSQLGAQMAELEQSALRSQMNSHFVFNCLTSIQQLIVSGNKTDANEFLVKFARLIRKTLEISAQPFVSVREEVDYLSEYLAVEQLRMSHQFSFSIIADEQVLSYKIPTLMLQAVAENCVRHGIKSMEEKNGLIHIHLSLADNQLKCVIQDNGIGRNAAAGFSNQSFTKHKSFGIDIIHKRLLAWQKAGDSSSPIEIIDLVNDDGSAAGTQVTIYLPILP